MIRTVKNMTLFKTSFAMMLCTLAMNMAHSHELSSQMEQRLTGNGKVYDFRFEDRFHSSVIKGIIEGGAGVKIDISKEAYNNEAPSFIAKNLTYTQFLKQASDRLNLKAVQLDQDRIMLVPK